MILNFWSTFSPPNRRAEDVARLFPVTSQVFRFIWPETKEFEAIKRGSCHDINNIRKKNLQESGRTGCKRTISLVTYTNDEPAGNQCEIFCGPVLGELLPESVEVWSAVANFSQQIWSRSPRSLHFWDPARPSRGKRIPKEKSATDNNTGKSHFQRRIPNTMAPSTCLRLQHDTMKTSLKIHGRHLERTHSAGY